jgi:two-component system, sensor histidine kinase and response regulator
MGGQGTKSQERLLIVDDASAMRDVLALKLEREGFAVLQADSVHAAEEQVGHGGVDMILLDIGLPDGNGVNWLLRLRGLHSPLDLPVIIISGLDNSQEVVGALRNGANDYITKPFDLAILLARVRTQLRLKRLKHTNTEFLRVASSDLKRPLVLMLDVARQLSSDYAAGKPVEAAALAALEKLIESGEDMKRVIGDLLELRAARDGRLDLTRLPTDIGAIVRQAVARNTHYAQSKQIELRMEFARDLPILMVDDFRIMQVAVNLINNAIKFSPRGTRTTVTTRRVDTALLCEVADSGPGITADDMQKLFTEYAQLQNRPTAGETSTGLGLAISRELIRLHNGEMGVKNNRDQGATFWFRLPLDADKG